jgi:hypothetical protein
MTVLLTVVVVAAIVGVGVGVMLYNDRREHKRAVENGFRR